MKMQMFWRLCTLAVLICDLSVPVIHLIKTNADNKKKK